MLGKGTSSNSETVSLREEDMVCCRIAACAGGQCQEILQSRAKVPARHRSEYFNVVNKDHLQYNQQTNLYARQKICWGNACNGNQSTEWPSKPAVLFNL